MGAAKRSLARFARAVKKESRFAWTASNCVCGGSWTPRPLGPRCAAPSVSLRGRFRECGLVGAHVQHGFARGAQLHYGAKKKQVQLASDKKDGPTAGIHTFDALEFLALLLAHIPDSHEILVRYYGAYSVRRRAVWRQAGILTEMRQRRGAGLGGGPETTPEDSPPWPQLLARRRRWAELLRRIFEVDPLACPRCGASMRILAFILDHRAIHAILDHLHKLGRDSRTAPAEELQAPSRAPPA